MEEEACMKSIEATLVRLDLQSRRFESQLIKYEEEQRRQNERNEERWLEIREIMGDIREKLKVLLPTTTDFPNSPAPNPPTSVPVASSVLGAGLQERETTHSSLISVLHIGTCDDLGAASVKPSEGWNDPSTSWGIGVREGQETYVEVPTLPDLHYESSKVPKELESEIEPPKDEIEIDAESRMAIKAINFLGRHGSIVLQNQNGPCALLALCNVLLLRNEIALPMKNEVSEQSLVSLVVDRLLSLQQNIGDAIEVLPSLRAGMDMNIKFQGIDDYECTQESAIFALLGIPLYHGWVVDPKDSATAEALGSRSWEDVRLEDLGDSEESMRQELRRSFLNNSRSQLTPYGLKSLREGLGDKELCVLFWNQHFHTMLKYKEELYLLATDEGYKEEVIVWEKMKNARGDTELCDSLFSGSESSSSDKEGVGIEEAEKKKGESSPEVELPSQIPRAQRSSDEEGWGIEEAEKKKGESSPEVEPPSQIPQAQRSSDEEGLRIEEAEKKKGEASPEVESPSQIPRPQRRRKEAEKKKKAQKSEGKTKEDKKKEKERLERARYLREVRAAAGVGKKKIMYF